jgi:hypothetical protein
MTLRNSTTMTALQTNKAITASSANLSRNEFCTNRTLSNFNAGYAVVFTKTGKLLTAFDTRLYQLNK